MKRSNIKILIVEYNAVQSLMFKQMVEERHYHVVGIVERGEEAIEKINELQPDLVIMDIFLNGDMTGIEVVQHIRDLGNEVAVVFVSGNSDAYYARKAEKNSHSTFLYKPIMRDDLRKAIRDLTETDTSSAKSSSWPFNLFS